MRKGLRYLVVPLLVAVLITSLTYFVTIPASYASVSGFPAPYVAFHPCCSGGGDAATGYSYFYDNTYVYSATSFVADCLVWLGIALAVAVTFTVRRFLIGTIAGAGVTLASLLSSPLASVYPFGGAESSISPMGFPYEYLTHYTTYSLGASAASSGYVFFLSAALADYALWTGIALAAVGSVFVATVRLQKRSPGPLEPPSQPFGNQLSSELNTRQI